MTNNMPEALEMAMDAFFSVHPRVMVKRWDSLREKPRHLTLRRGKDGDLYVRTGKRGQEAVKLKDMFSATIVSRKLGIVTFHQYEW